MSIDLETTLIAGRKYRYGFPGCPSGVGIYLGRASFSNDWIVFEVKKNNSNDTEIVYFNLRNLNMIAPYTEES